MKNNTINLPKENELILLLCDKDYKNKKKEIENIVTNPLDWFSVFTDAMIHKVLFICFEKLKELKLLNICLSKGNLSLLLLNHWDQLYQVNLLKNKQYFEELQRIHTVLKKANIEYAVAKGGIALIGSVYSISERKMYDIDLIANKTDYKLLDESLKSLGFFNANYDHDLGEYIEVEKDEIRKWLLHTRGLPNYVKPIPLSKHILLQVQFKIGSTITGDIRDASHLIEKATESNNNLSIVAQEDLAIQLALHIYRETIEPSFKAWNMDWNLIKICDFDRYINHYLTEDKAVDILISRIEELNYIEPFLYSVYFTNLIYPSLILEELKMILEAKSDKSFVEKLYQQKEILNLVFNIGSNKEKENLNWEKLMGSKTL